MTTFCLNSSLPRPPDHHALAWGRRGGPGSSHEAGMDGYMAKPVDLEELSQILKLVTSRV